MTDHAARGEAALNQSQPAEAIAHYTKALAQNPTAATWLIKRSTAFQRASRHQEALRDAEDAVIASTKRAKRELIADAQLRRAIALFMLERYGDAGFVLAVVERLNPKEKSLAMWKAQLSAKLVKLGSDDEKKEVTVTELPEAGEAQNADVANDQTQTTAPASSAISQTPADKIRHEWYQNNDAVTFALLAKGVPKEKASVDIGPRALTIAFPLASGSTYDFSLEPLFAAVEPSMSTYRVLSTKIEVVLKKASPGVAWSALEASEGTMDAAANPAFLPSSNQEHGPAYPTSSRSGPKNWDQIAKSFSKPSDSGKKSNESAKHTEKAKQDADVVYLDDDADDVSDPANHFFQKLFKNSDPDTQRAMMKSYQESGGTALNTSWDQVKAGRVPVTPPSGMEEKQWES